MKALRAIGRRTLERTGHAWRSVLRRPVFIAVTGSCGKTTTKEMIAAILRTRYRGYQSPGNCNTPYHVTRTILRTKPWHEYCVFELAAAYKSVIPLELPLRLVQPRIGVVTNVGTDHLSLFQSVEAIAAAKSKLVSNLPADGIAILNADDPRVLRMAHLCRGKVITYGVSPMADVRAEHVRGAWPDTLSFACVHAGRSVAIKTQLCGHHWVSSVLGALAVGCAMGIPLEAAAAAVGRVRPYPSRMSPVTMPDAVTFICDDEKAPLWSFDAFFDFVRNARATRKILVLGTISDYPGDAGRPYAAIGRQALDVSDAVVGVGPQATHYLKARRHRDGAILRVFPSVSDTSSFLREFLRPGDLVAIKGSGDCDGLIRIVRDWKPTAEVPGALRDTSETRIEVCQGDGDLAQVIVGLGNPGPRAQGTPHNVGYEVVDVVANAVQAKWRVECGAGVARVTCEGGHLMLVKLNTLMNESGTALKRLAAAIGFGPERTVVILDDLNLPPGVVRCREGGSAGGHNGMQSILVAWQTDQIARIKVGVGRPPVGQAIETYLLTPFDAERRNLVDRACEEASARALQIARAAARRRQ